MHRSFTLQPLDIQRVAQLAQPIVRVIEIQVVVLVVAGHEHHRRRPAVAWCVAAQAEVGAGQLRSPAVGADIAGQHQQIGARSRACHEGRVGF
ncbi:hypothetical protein G6F22_021850 [Rhizopus arrhizus]|nr:hypothetical protein G6F22_021850 [Rhizopus arrhizus]